MRWIMMIVLVVCGAAMTATSSHAEDPLPFWLEWGSTGSGDGEFNGASGIAIHQSSVFVTDSGNHRVQKFTPSGQFQSAWGTFGAGDGQFENPAGVAVDASGVVFVAEVSGLGRIQLFSPAGSFLSAWPYAGRGRIAVDPTGQFVYAPEGRFVYKYTRDGVLLAQWTLSNNARESDHWAIAVGPSGNVYVLDRGEFVVRKLTPDGTLILSWGTFGANVGEFKSPSGIAVDGMERVYVADTGNGRVQKFSNTGTFLVAWGTFSALRDLAVDVDGSVYCLNGNRVQKFGDSGTPAQNVTWGRIKSLYR